MYLNLENIPSLNLYKLTVFRPKCPNHFRHHCPNETVMGVRFAPFFVHYTDATSISIPLGYEIITKTEDKWSEEYQKYIILKIEDLFLEDF